MGTWHKVSDETPPIGKLLILWGGGSKMRLGRICELGQWRNSLGYPVDTIPTHWMLVEPPAKEER